LIDDADAQYVLMITGVSEKRTLPWGWLVLLGYLLGSVSVVGLAVVVVLHMTTAIRRFQTQSISHD